MDLAGSFSRIVFLAFPGILASLIYGKLKGKGSRKDWEDFMEIMIFSVVSYSIYGLIIQILQWFGARVQFVFLDALFDPQRPISILEIVWASLIGFGLALLASKAYSSGWLFRFARKLGVTSRWSDGDVWSHFHSSPTGETWVYVRDHKLNRVYYGWIYGYSESERNANCG